MTVVEVAAGAGDGDGVDISGGSDDVVDIGGGCCRFVDVLLLRAVVIFHFPRAMTLGTRGPGDDA
jgi:hypothetical protein